MNDIIEGVDDIWQYISVIYSPKITTGVDYTFPSDVYGFFTGRSVDYSAFVQMLERTRNKTSLKISVTVQNRVPTYFSMKDVEDDLKRKIKGTKILFDETVNYVSWDIYGNPILSDDPFTKLYIETKFYNDLSRMYPREQLLYLLDKRGYKIKLLDLEEDNLTHVITKCKLVEIKEDKKEYIRLCLKNNEVIPENNLEDLQRKADFMNIKLKEACETNGVEWDLLTSKEGINTFIKLRYTLSNDLDYKFENKVKSNGLLKSTGDYVVQYKSINRLEELLGIKDKYEIKPEYVYDNYDKLIKIDKDLLYYIKRIFGIKASYELIKQQIKWYDLYTLLIKCYRNYYGKDLMDTIKNQKRINNNRYNMRILKWDKNRIEKIIKVIEPDHGENHCEYNSIQ